MISLQRVSLKTEWGQTDSLDRLLTYLTEGQRLAYANGLIGSGLIELGELINDQKVLNGGQWIVQNINESQATIDTKVAEAFEDFVDIPKVASLTEKLRAGQDQEVADSLIAELCRLMKSKFS